MPVSATTSGIRLRRISVSGDPRQEAPPSESEDSGQKKRSSGPRIGTYHEMLRPKADARVVFFRSLSVMILAGIQIDRALKLLAKQSEDAMMTLVANGLADRIVQGSSLSYSMAHYPGAFSKLQVGMVRMAEQTGTIDRTLAELARYEEKERDTILKIKSTLTYPAFVFAIAFLILVIVPPYMMDGLFKMIEGSGVEPPLLTKIVMRATSMTRSPFFYIALFGSIALAWTFLPRYLKRPDVKMKLSEYILKVPVVGRVYRTVTVARFSRALGVQLDCGISPLAGFALSAQATDNPVLERDIEKAIQGLKDGLPVNKCLTLTGFFPVLLIKMVQVGEESATLPDMLKRTAAMYEVEMDNVLETFTSLLEPMVMVVMGLVVGVLVLSTMLPIAQVLQNL